MESIQGDGKAAEALTTDDTWVGSAGGKHTHYAHIFGHTHSASVCLLISTFSIPDTVIQPCSYLAQNTQTHCTRSQLSYYHGYTNTNTATVQCIYSNTHECKYCKCLFYKQLLSCVGRLNSVQALQKKNRSYSLTAAVFLLCFRMGGIPAKTHKEEKLLIFLGIIDILQSYRCWSLWDDIILFYFTFFKILVLTCVVAPWACAEQHFVQLCTVYTDEWE